VVSRVLWASKGKQVPTWVGCVASSVCDVTGVVPIISRSGLGGPVIEAWGLSADLGRATDLLGAIVGQIDALAKSSGFRGRTALNNFRLGAQQTVAERLREGRKAALAESSATGAALVLVKDAARKADRVMRAEVGTVGGQVTGSMCRGAGRSGLDLFGRRA